LAKKCRRDRLFSLFTSAITSAIAECRREFQGLKSGFSLDWSLKQKNLIGLLIGLVLMGDSSYRLNFDQGKQSKIQHHS
jgi:putative exporter of polyketide antibiotics